MLGQLVADLTDPAITYLLGGHYFGRTNHPRYRHFPAVFALRQGQVANVEVGPDFVAFDTEFVRYPERGEPHYPGPWEDRFLTAVAAGLADPVNHYLVNTTAFESPHGPVLLGLLHLHAQTTRDLAIEAEAFTCSVLLDTYDRQQWSTVRVNFAQVWQVLRSDSPQVDLEEVEDAGGLLYDAPEVLSAYARQGRLA